MHANTAKTKSNLNATSVTLEPKPLNNTNSGNNQNVEWTYRSMPKILPNLSELNIWRISCAGTTPAPITLFDGRQVPLDSQEMLRNTEKLRFTAYVSLSEELSHDLEEDDDAEHVGKSGDQRRGHQRRVTSERLDDERERCPDQRPGQANSDHRERNHPVQVPEVPLRHIVLNVVRCKEVSTDDGERTQRHRQRRGHQEFTPEDAEPVAQVNLIERQRPNHQRRGMRHGVADYRQTQQNE